MIRQRSFATADLQPFGETKGYSRSVQFCLRHSQPLLRRFATAFCSPASMVVRRLIVVYPIIAICTYTALWFLAGVVFATWKILSEMGVL